MYASIFDAHLLPRVSGSRLRDVKPETVARLRADLERDGVGPAATRKALTLLQGIFSQAVAWGHVPTNPVAGVRKPSGQARPSGHTPSPERVETMRRSLRSRNQQRDATLVCVLAYAGLRPQEALALTWENVGERTLLIDRAVSNGVMKQTKTGQTRSVRLLAPLAADLAEWRLARGRPSGDVLVFPASGNTAWNEDAWRNWRRRVFAPVAADVGLVSSRPYNLRHAFCSLLIREGRSPVEVARQAGNAPSTTLNTYGHVMDEAEGADRVPAEVAIRAAREIEVSGECPSAESDGAR